MSDYDAIFESVSGSGGKQPLSEYDSIMQGLMPTQSKEAQQPAQSPAFNAADGMSTYEKMMAGTGKAFVDLGRGVGQYIPKGWAGHVSQQDIIDSRATDAPLMATGAGKAGNLLGGVASVIPTAFVPGANTIAGAGVVGSLMGLLQPSVSKQETLQNTALGAVGGAGGQYLGNKIVGALGRTVANSKAAAAEFNGFNSVKNETLQAGQNLGYVTPVSAVNPSFTNNLLESVAGKAAIGQEAALRNQALTTKLVSAEAGLPKNTPLTEGALEAIRKNAGKSYEAVGKLSPIAKQDLEALKQARFDANAEFKFYNRTGDPATLKKAQALKGDVNDLENSLLNEAKAAGKDELIPALKAARTQIAKTYDIGRTVNVGTGDASAPVLGRMLDKGKYLTGDLKTIGAMQQAFPKFMREASDVPASGVNQLNTMMAPMMAAAGQVVSGNPLGAVAGGFPFLGGAARNLLLSKPYQNMFAKIPEKDVAKTLSLLDFISRKSQPALPYAGATGLINFGQE